MERMVTTVGSITLDVFMHTNDGMVIRNRGDIRRQVLLAFEYGAKIEAESLSLMCGGAAANTAVTFQRFGLRPVIVGAVGRDVFAQFCVSQLRRRGILTSSVRRFSHPTSLSVIIDSGSKHAHYILTFRGASKHLQITPKIAEGIRTPWLYIATLAGDWKQSLTALFGNAKRGQLIVWNPGASQLLTGVRGLRRFLASTQVLIVNEDEAIELLADSGRRVKGVSPARLARELHSFGPKTVVITRGHRGSVAFDGKKTFNEPARRTKLVNKTGAGDAYGSGLVVGLIKFRNLAKAMRLAAYNSASVVSQYGAQAGILSVKDLRRMNYHES